MREELYLRQLKVLYRVVKNVRKKYQGDTKNQDIINDLNRISLEIHTLQEDIERNYEKSTVHPNSEDGK